jgi:hypothetical protein
MSDSIPKFVYVLIGSMLVILIVVAIVSLVSSGGLLSKFSAIVVVGLAVLLLFFGHKRYKKEHTLIGRASSVGEKLASAIGLGPRKSFLEEMMS